MKAPAFFSKISTFVRAKKKWKLPQKADVLQFDSTGADYFRPYLKNLRVEMLCLCDQEINIPILMRSMFSGRKLMCAYRENYIKAVQPQMVITFIDNSSIFFDLAKRHSGIKFIAVQNGIRSYYADIFEMLEELSVGPNRFRVDYYLAFGSMVAQELDKYLDGAKPCIGSFRNNLVPKTRRMIPGRLAYVSQYRDFNGGFISLGGKRLTQEKFAGKSDRIILSFLMDYARKSNKELCIIPCMGRDKTMLAKEKEYFYSMTGERLAFTDWTWHGSSYDSADEAEVTVNLDSSMGHESAARGNKTAFFSIRTEQMDVAGYTYGWPGDHPDEGPFWTKIANEDAFARILDHLFAITPQEWKAELIEHKFSEITTYDPGNTVFLKIINGCVKAEARL